MELSYSERYSWHEASTERMELGFSKRRSWHQVRVKSKFVTDLLAPSSLAGWSLVEYVYAESTAVHTESIGLYGERCWLLHCTAEEPESGPAFFFVDKV